MVKRKFVKGVALAALLTIGVFTPQIAKSVQKSLVVDKGDGIVYEQPNVVDFDKPNVVSNGVYAAVTSATSVTIHYHNDDARCDERELWIWCSGVVGSAFKPTVSGDKKDMQITLNFTGDLSNFSKKKGLYFIVKYVGTWTGQSDNMYVDYAEYVPDANGHTEVWCIPGEGNGVEMYPNEALTKMDRFQVATFKDWKTIEIISTAVPSSLKLYALTANYMAIASVATRDDLNRYLIYEASQFQTTDVIYNSIPCKKYTLKLNYTVKVNVQYYLEGIFPQYPDYIKTKNVSFHELYEYEETVGSDKVCRFEQYYTYNGNDLGATLNPNGTTTFKVWAPTAERVRLMLYESGISADYAEENHLDGGSDKYRGYDMTFQPGGVWAITLNKYLDNQYYNYYVQNSLGSSEVVDPYAKACGVNGQRGMVVNFASTNPENWNTVPLKWDGEEGYDINYPNELSIYETHIRDLTMDETWTGTKLHGTYSAFVEPGTTYSKNGKTVTTGFDHLTELGIKAVHLEPVFDNDNLEGLNERSYNWGYNPLNFNCVDGSYSTDPYNGASRIKEFKQLVQAFANNGNHTRVIMDVVYNHVSSAPSSNFNKLMPRYYFRMTDEGAYYDGSGCGNEVKSEAPMMSKFIVDSLCWWAKEYKIKGFRFDLMALIDWQTAKKTAKELYKIDPDIYLYGEGWSGDGSSGNMKNKEPGDKYYGNWGCDIWTIYNKLIKEDDMCFVGTFNSAGRNAIAGETGKIDDWGFIDQGSDHVGGKSNIIADLLVGYHAGQERVDPNQCVNYSSCHDDFTTFDHLMYALNNSLDSDYPGLCCAATAAVECTIMFSNGVAFMRGGEETFQSKEVSQEDLELYGYDRTVEIRGKRISDNSYRLSDYTNAFRWDRKIEIDGVSTYGYYEAIKDAVHARNNLTKYNKDELDAHNPFDEHSPMNVWGRGNGSTVIGMKNGEYFFFVAGCNEDNISFGAITTYNKKVFCSNPADGGYYAGSDYIKLGWYTCVCLTK